LFRRKQNEVAEKPSLISTAVRKFSVLTATYIVAVFAFIWLVQYQLTPSFYADVFGRIENDFRSHESALVTAFLQGDLQKANLVVEDCDFLSVAKKEIISRAGGSPNFSCSTELEDATWGQICKEEGLVKALIPIRSADQLLGWLQVQVPAKLSDWTPYARIHQAIVYSAIILIILTFAYLMRFLRSTIIPVRRAIQELAQADDTQALRSVGAKLPFRELVGLTTNLVKRADDLNKTKQDLQEAERKAQLSAVASQVAHDLRSPVLALTALSKEVNKISKEDLAKSIGTSARRIDQISKDILEKCEVKSPAQLETGYTFIFPVLQTVIAEASLVTPEVPIKFEVLPTPKSLGIRIPESDLSRIISNLIGNATAAVIRKGSGEITVSVEDSFETVALIIKDTGQGMTEQVLRAVLEKGGSFNTPHGHGLGVSYVKSITYQHGGSLDIQSGWMEGTTVRLTFPQVATPSWLVSELQLVKDSKIIVIDDDRSIHNMWRDKLEGFDCDFFTKPPQDAEADLYIVDQEIRGHSETGLQFIERSGIAGKAILSSGHFSDPNLQAGVERTGCRFLPKFLISELLVVSSAEPHDVDLVLIDDDIVTRQSWELMAKINEKRIAVFQSIEAFNAESVSTAVPIYIDRHLGDGDRGESFVFHLKNEGFKNVHLISGEVKTGGSDLIAGSKEFPVS
jgi:signal transduction histidine kinase